MYMYGKALAFSASEKHQFQTNIQPHCNISRNHFSHCPSITISLIGSSSVSCPSSCGAGGESLSIRFVSVSDMWSKGEEASSSEDCSATT